MPSCFLQTITAALFLGNDSENERLSKSHRARKSDGLWTLDAFHGVDRQNILLPFGDQIALAQDRGDCG